MTENPHCFPAVEKPDAAMLILGSVPSVRSLAEKRYYGHPRNAFWPIMRRILGFDPELDYEAEKKMLNANKIALWDVAASCLRDGSLDSAIRTETVVANDFESFFKEHSRISRVFFNGCKAEELYRRLVLKDRRGNSETCQKLPNALTYVRLPSTSPAMASLSFDEKLEIWRSAILAPSLFDVMDAGFRLYDRQNKTPS